MTFTRDPVALLATFVFIGFIISIIFFIENTKTPLEINQQPQHFLVRN